MIWPTQRPAWEAQETTDAPVDGGLGFSQVKTITRTRGIKIWISFSVRWEVFYPYSHVFFQNPVRLWFQKSLATFTNKLCLLCCSSRDWKKMSKFLVWLKPVCTALCSQSSNKGDETCQGHQPLNVLSRVEHVLYQRQTDSTVRRITGIMDRMFMDHCRYGACVPMALCPVAEA